MVSPAESKPAPNEAPEPKPRRRPPPKLAKATPKAQPSEMPKPPEQASAMARRAQPAPVRKFTVSMEATVPSGAVAVPVPTNGRGWAFGAADGDPDAPRRLPGDADGDPAGRGPPSSRPVDVAELSTLPVLVYQPPQSEMRALYPSRPGATASRRTCN